MIEDLKQNQFGSKLYLLILFVLIIPFALSCLWVFTGLFLLKISKLAPVMQNSMKVCLCLGIPAFTLHCICSLIASPYIDGYKKKASVDYDPLLDDFPGPRYYVLRSGTAKSSKNVERREHL